MEKKENEKDFDVIFAFAFGSPEDLVSNSLIAERARCIFEERNEIITLLTQKDIVNAFPLFFIRRHKKILIGDDHKIGYPSTLKLIKQFNKLAKENNWKKVLVIAAPVHAKRCVRDLRKMGFDAYEDGYLREKYSMSEIWWYNKNSTQFWTRSAFFWWSREIPLRILRKLSWKLYELISERV